MEKSLKSVKLSYMSFHTNSYHSLFQNSEFPYKLTNLSAWSYIQPGLQILKHVFFFKSKKLQSNKILKYFSPKILKILKTSAKT